ncbi:MAG: hypothetical protein IJS19_07140, partial [Muribaculaceae bacterium]|nr:hypothetical protein [Muribaculaceae bacterium]
SESGTNGKPLKYGVIYVAENPDAQFDAYWLVSGQSSRLNPFAVERIADPAATSPELIALRMNVGNVGRKAMLRMRINDQFSAYELERFVDALSDVASLDAGDKVLPPAFSWRTRSVCCESHIDPDDYESMRPMWRNRIVDPMWRFRSKHRKRQEKISDGEIQKEECEIKAIESERQADLNAIRAMIVEYVTKYHADPSDLMKTLLSGKIIIGNEQALSPLVVNGDLKIVLPHYDEMEVKMPAMCRAIYILFLRHHDGIALRDLPDYRRELSDIYSLVKPGRDDAIAEAVIANLIDPMNNTLNEYLSKIKRCFASCVLDDALARNYYICGRRNEPYGIPLSRELITLPRALS